MATGHSEMVGSPISTAQGSSSGNIGSIGGDNEPSMLDCTVHQCPFERSKLSDTCNKHSEEYIKHPQVESPTPTAKTGSRQHQNSLESLRGTCKPPPTQAWQLGETPHSRRCWGKNAASPKAQVFCEPALGQEGHGLLRVRQRQLQAPASPRRGQGCTGPTRKLLISGCNPFKQMHWSALHPRSARGPASSTARAAGSREPELQGGSSDCA